MTYTSFWNRSLKSWASNRNSCFERSFWSDIRFLWWNISMVSFLIFFVVNTSLAWFSFNFRSSWILKLLICAKNRKYKFFCEKWFLGYMHKNRVERTTWEFLKFLLSYLKVKNNEIQQKKVQGNSKCTCRYVFFNFPTLDLVGISKKIFVVLSSFFVHIPRYIYQYYFRYPLWWFLNTNNLRLL